MKECAPSRRSGECLGAFFSLFFGRVVEEEESSTPLQSLSFGDGGAVRARGPKFPSGC